MEKVIVKENSLNVLKELKKLGKPIEARELSSKLSMEYEILMTQAVYELQTKSLATFTESAVTELIPTEELQSYFEGGLPERQLFNFLKSNNLKEITIDDFKAKSKMDQKIFFIGLSNMKKNKWVVESKGAVSPTILIYNENPEILPIEHLLLEFKKKKTVILEELPKELHAEVDNLSKRKLIQKHAFTKRIISLTDNGKKIKETDIEIKGEEYPRLTADMLADGSWKEKLSKLKVFEVQNAGPKISAGKIHPMTLLINQVREIFLSMGFTEIKGPMIEMAFYNFDSLYQPQDHPAREMHDTFYLRNPLTAKLPQKKLVDAIKETHENGGSSKSTGWGYKWDENIAKKMLLRTHTTATTIRRLSKVVQDKDKLPLKVFSIDRVFRNEKVDVSHLAEFMQIEGIVIGDNVNLSNLRGILSEFYRKMGFSKIITRPGFFPYTEPSMEISVYTDILHKWLEMGGSGIFRPEVTYPWGIKEPTRVLAWGMGFERLAMLYLQRNDIRDLYRSPLSWLRDVEYV